MAGINSLGVGSGVLTSDLIDKLRTADEATIIKPLEDKITLANQKDDAFALLSSLMTTFQSSTSNLDGDNLYLSRAVSGNTDAVTVTAESGSNVQSFNITDISKAESDVWNSTALGEKSTAIADLGAGTFTMTLDGKDYAIDYAADSTLNSIRDSINEAASDVMTASVLQVGTDSYELVMTAKDTNKAITFTNDTNDGSDANANSLTNILNLQNIQAAKGATFKYNGVDIARDSNEITDLAVGVTITLNQNQAATDNASINITQNSTSISSEMSLFVSGYNSLITNLQDLTSSDRDSGAVGIFNGESFVKSISRNLTDMINQVDSKGNSLVDYGISLDKHGVMSLDNNVFATKFAADPEGMETFFSGDSETDGIFTKLNDKMTQYTGYNKLLSNFSDQLDSSKKSITDRYDKQKAALDSRYGILTKKFVAYDALISKLNNSFSSLQQTIAAQFANNDN